MPQQFDVGQLLAGIERSRDQIHREAGRALEAAGEFVLGEAVAVVPLDKGDLSNSGRVFMDRAELRCWISFDTPYAVRQHEDMTYQHAAGRQAKYLEQPLFGNAARVKAYLSSRLGGAS